MIVAARGDRETALGCFDEEIAAAETGHVYAREFVVNAHVASGFTMLAAGNRDVALAAFTQALTHASGHPKASVGIFSLAVTSGDEASIGISRAASEAAIAELTRGERHVEAALVAAGMQVADGRVDQAIENLDRFLNAAPAGPAGWIIPVDPMLAAIQGNRGATALFSRLAARAA